MSTDLPDWLIEDTNPSRARTGLTPCAQCDDGDGVCVFPYFGVAPHIHAGGNEMGVGSTQLMPRAMWGGNFREDPDSRGQGIYLRCPHCGAGEQA